MKTLASLLVTLALATSAIAGSPTYSGKSGKGVVQPAPTSQDCDCFAPGFAMGVFGGAIFPSHRGNGDAGGGILAEYFFTENIGIEGSYGLFATDSEHHQFDGSLVLRAPIKSCCIAPYMLLGGGVGANGSTRGDYHVGGGIEARFAKANCMGVFLDGTYHFASGSDTDFAIARLGVKFRF